MTKRLRWLVVVFAVFGLVAASCGDDEADDGADTAAAQAEAEAAAAAAAAEADAAQAEADAAAARAEEAAAAAAEAEAALAEAMDAAEGTVDPEVVAELEAALAEAEAEAAAAEAEAAEAAAAAAAAAAAEPEDTGPQPLRAAVVTPSAENDLAFSQSIVDALHRMEDAGLLSEVAITPGTFIVEDAGVALRNYAESGYDLVIAHGSQYGGLLEEIAPDFPGTAFAWGTSVETFGQPNISAYTTRSDQGGYAMGVMAARLAGGSPVGIVGPIEVGDAKLFVDGFRAGVEAGGGTANAVYTDSFADVQLAAEAAQSFIDNGHAVLTGTAQMTVGAIGVARENGIPWFGTQSNQTSVAPEIVVANQVYKWDVVLDDLVRDIQGGSMGGSAYTIDFSNGGLVLEYNDAYDLPADVRAAGDAAVASFMAEPLRAAVVTPSAENDLAFSQSIVDALHRMEDAGLLSEVAITPGTFIVEDAGVALRNYAESGYDLVIAHGSQYGGLLEEIAPDFPGTAFAWGTSVETFGQPNISAYTTRSDQGGYAMGVMAARLAGGSPVGIVGPIEVGDAKLFVDGFRAGVEAGGGTANAVYTDSFADVQLAAEAAQSFIDNGHAVLTGTAQMTVGAIGVARENGIPWFGTQSNQTSVAPEIVVANQVYKWDVVLDDLVRDIQGGSMGGSAYTIDFANGGLVIEYNDAYDLPADARAAIDNAVAGFTDGSLSTGVG
ncbi:MAG: BMP family ABC transporter substrate-binding protein [Acidimicrobiaceae bacterium]|nr:BMP family ABC transporter substrate-binding protein [Acidimicrobiaceae bacterium]